MLLRLIVVFCVFLTAVSVSANQLKADLAPLIGSSCIYCHGEQTESSLNFEEIGYDLSDAKTFALWKRIYGRIKNNEMPPEPMPRPDSAILAEAMKALKESLLKANLVARKNQRTPLRRLTNVEYTYTLNDLLLVDEDYSDLLVPETDKVGFDNYSREQEISSLHVQSYLKAADKGINAVLQHVKRPLRRRREVDYLNSEWLKGYEDLPIEQGGRLHKIDNDSLIIFTHLPFLTRSDFNQFFIKETGRYRITMEAQAYQAETPVTLTFTHTSEKSGKTRLVAAYDLFDDEARTFQFEIDFLAGDYFYPAAADLDALDGKYNVYKGETQVGVLANGNLGVIGFKGEGIALKSLIVDGPITSAWPPPSRKNLFYGIDSKIDGTLNLTKAPYEHVLEIIEHLGKRAFRRPLKDEEVKAFASLAKPAIEEGREFMDLIDLPVRAMLSSPQFLYHTSKPGKLDDYALATRLSYFLWKSMPDDELFEIAGKGTLSEPKVLSEQVERMLNDDKSTRFVQDFLAQWLSLRDINATFPDTSLFPESDELLIQSMQKETELFFAELINEDLNVRELIDSDFTFLNKRLAEHYDIPNIKGHNFRKVTLPEDSPRGGLLTQASILKVTANGTTTTPVKRGNFVLTNILGTPPNPPPPNIGGVDPDTRGATTIREILAKHRSEEICASCHIKIDPPGFALESFNPIGGYRERYRSTGIGDLPPGQLHGRSIIEYKLGLEVDSSGQTPEGFAFEGIRDYKKILLEMEDQIASHFISLLISYATGENIEFADQDELASIVDQASAAGYPLRTIIHQVVQSNLFRSQ